MKLDRDPDPVGEHLGCVLVLTIVILLVAGTYLAASNWSYALFMRFKALPIAVVAIVYGTISLIWLGWRRFGFLRRDYAKYADEELQRLRDRVQTELNLARDEQRPLNSKGLWKEVDLAKSAVSNRPEVGEIESLLKAGEAELASAPNSAVTPLERARRSLFLDLRSSPVAIGALAGVVVGVVLVILAAATKHPIPGVIGFALQWAGAGLLLRRTPFIVSFGGSFMIAVLVTTQLVQVFKHPR